MYICGIKLDENNKKYKMMIVCTGRVETEKKGIGCM
jgi:hypothetical protein